MVNSLLLLALFFLAYAHMVNGQLFSHCKTKCGKIKFDYPFGSSPGCFYEQDASFRVTCNETGLFVGDFPVTSISPQTGELHTLISVSHSCLNGSEFAREYDIQNFSLSPKNSLTLVGCSAYSYISTNKDEGYGSGCISECNSNQNYNGKGWCTMKLYVPEEYQKFSTKVHPISMRNGTSVESINPCAYAFLSENSSFVSNYSKDLGTLRKVREVPVVLDWSIGKKACDQVENKSICGVKTLCINSVSKKGYICRCHQGYSGNPYLPNGCQGEGSGKEKNQWWIPVFSGITIVVLAILFGVTCIQNRRMRRREKQRRQHIFEQNGGDMLIQRLSGGGPSNANIEIFTEAGIKEATNGYDESRILGQGGQGTVYKGILPDNSIVAVKKARLGDRSQIEQFINELLLLSQINHRNVVKLLGCCLETAVPLLVYEFINSGSLFDHLHGSTYDSSLTWENRLRIAIEVAGTLAYLHSYASVPIIHRDVKTANILLDEQLTAKVADFGASRLIPMDQDQLTTMVQGTVGYIDPEYFNTGHLNDKSDVYSFGVVLMELLTGQQAVCFERPQASRHLVSYFTTGVKENRLHEILDGQVLKEDNQREVHEAAKIGVKCTRIKGEERPTMKQVAAELEALRVNSTKGKRTDQYPEEIENYLLGGNNLVIHGETSSTDIC